MALKVGIIGCGAITVRRHAPEFSVNPDSEIGGFYDFRKEKAEMLVKEYGGNVYDSVDELLADKSIDAVSVCTPNTTHASITIAALESGKHVLVEKPMATSIEEAKAMVKAAEKSGKILMVAQNQRFVPAHIKAREIIEKGMLGRIISFRTCFKHGGPEFWVIEKNNQTWYFDKSKVTYGVVGDLGSHKLDLVRYLLGREVEEVLASGATLEKRDPDGNPISVYDTAFAIFKFEGGIMGSMEVSWCNHGVMEDSTVIYGEEGVLRLLADPDYPLVIEMKNGEKINWKLPDANNGSGVIDAFVDSILQGKESPVGGQDALNSMAVIDACMKSAESGSWVRPER